MSIQLFGQDPEIMRSAAAEVARTGADLIDINMGCPVPKVCKTGAGAALLKDPDTAVAVAMRRARGQRAPGHREAARRGRRGRATGSSSEAGVAGITFHPRTVKVRHKGRARLRPRRAARRRTSRSR